MKKLIFPAVSAAQTPPISGGYTNVIPIPVNDPQAKVVSGALFKPEGAGPFPAVIYMSSCHSLGSPLDADHEKTLIAHHLGKSVAVLVVDSFTARGAKDGVCDKMLDVTWYYTRARDAQAAGKLLTPSPVLTQAMSSLRVLTMAQCPPSWLPIRRCRLKR
jgi:dienelactone hydrolase